MGGSGGELCGELPGERTGDPGADGICPQAQLQGLRHLPDRPGCVGAAVLFADAVTV